MSLIIDIASAMVTELNAGSFTPAVVAVRHYRPQFDLSDLKSLRVSVVPRSVAITSVGRNLNQHDLAIDVAVQKKVDPADAAELDELMGLVEQIGDFFRLRRLSGAGAAAVWSKTENVPVYSVEHLEQQRVFTSVLTITFRVVR